MTFNGVAWRASTNLYPGRAASRVSILLAVCVVWLVPFATTPADAATITVSPGQTISSGISAASTGDTVLVKAGTYSGFSLNKSVIVKSEVQYGARLTSGVSISASNCTVDGFDIDGGGIIASGTQSGTTPSNVKVLNNHCYRSSYLYKVIGSNWLVEGNDFERVVYSGGGGDADYGRMFGTGHVFRRNFLHGTTFGDGQDVPPNTAHTDCMQYFGNNGEILHNVTIEQNYFTEFFQGFLLADENQSNDIQNLTIRDNILWGTPLPNTGNMNGRPSWGIYVGKNIGGQNVVIENNLVYNCANYLGINGSSMIATMGKNIFAGSAGTVYQHDGTVQSNIQNTGNLIWGISNVNWTFSTDVKNLNPQFANESNPLGPDGVPFTADDGWRPTNTAAALFGPRITGGTPPPPPPPTPVVDAVNDSFSGINEDTSNQTLNVLSNDTVSVSGTLSISNVGSPNRGGTVTIVSGTSLRYTPAANFSGSETFSYTAVGSAGGQDSATVTVTVAAVNDPPNGSNDSYTVQGGSSNNIFTVLANDSIAPDSNETLTVSAVGAPNNGGAAAIDQTTRISYTPAAQFSGTETFSYTLRDSNGGTDTASVTVTVQEVAPPPPPPPSNIPPVAANDEFTVSMNSSANALAVLVNDSDADGDLLAIVDLTPASAGGTVSVSGSALLYSPPTDFAGKDTFSYTISDGNGGESTASVSVDVENVNSTPLAVSDTFLIDMDSSGNTLNVLANDSDPDDGDSLHVASLGNCNRGGTVSMNGNAVVYTPASGFQGNEVFSYTVADASGATASAQVTATIENTKPQAKPDWYKVRKNGGSSRLKVTRNDSWTWGDDLTIELDSSPARLVAGGSVAVVGKFIVYAPPQGFVGTDVFTYAVRDEHDQSATGEVTITVSEEFGVDFCDDFPAFTAQIAALWDDLGIDSADLEGDTIPDDFMVEAMQVIACFETDTPLGTALSTAYLINLLQLDDETSAAAFSEYREVIAALLAMNTSIQNGLVDALANAGIDITGKYEVVWRDAEGNAMPQSLPGVALIDGYSAFDQGPGLEQPFSASGDIDLDAKTNLVEYENVVAAGGGSTEFANAVNDGSLDGSNIGGDGGGGCFIATAAYGTPLAGEINVLRDVRDRFMLTTAFGGVFADTYYRLSPPIARIVADHPALAASVRVALSPVVALGRAALAAPMAFGLAMLMPALLAAARLRRRGHKA